MKHDTKLHGNVRWEAPEKLPGNVSMIACVYYVPE